MPARYAFVSHWRVSASPERCWAELERMLRGEPSWWRAVRVDEPVPAVTVGERVGVCVRSILGYRLRIVAELVEVVPGARLVARSTGDLDGTGRVEFAPTAAGTLAVFHWEVETRRRWMNATAPTLRPVFSGAHALVMRAGERALRRAVGSDPRNAGNPGDRTERRGERR